MLKLNDSNDAGNEKLGFISNKFNHTERDIARRGKTDQVSVVVTDLRSLSFDLTVHTHFSPV